MIENQRFFKLSKQISEAVLFFSKQGWCPATSSNFSARFDEQSLVISQSGRDKSIFAEKDMMLVDNVGNAISPAGAKPSAETLIHTKIYELLPQTNAVFHTHSIYVTLLSMALSGHVEFKGYELQKGLDGVSTHDVSVRLPIFENSQNMAQFVEQNLTKMKNLSAVPGFLIKGHGLYAWGNDIASAKRHTETLEFLVQCEWEKLKR